MDPTTPPTPAPTTTTDPSAIPPPPPCTDCGTWPEDLVAQLQPLAKQFFDALSALGANKSAALELERNRVNALLQQCIEAERRCTQMAAKSVDDWRALAMQLAFEAQPVDAEPVPTPAAPPAQP